MNLDDKVSGYTKRDILKILTSLDNRITDAVEIVDISGVKFNGGYNSKKASHTILYSWKYIKFTDDMINNTHVISGSRGLEVNDDNFTQYFRDIKLNKILD